MSKQKLLQTWERDKGKIFGALCRALSSALANHESIRVESLPRMADFATWITAAEAGFGWEQGTFMRAYEENRKRMVDMALDADAVAIAVMRLMENHINHEWYGTASELLTILNGNTDLIFGRSWPKQPNILSGRLRRAATFLREKGIEVEWIKSGDRKIHIYRVKGEDPTYNPLLPSADVEYDYSSIPDLPPSDFDEDLLLS